MKKTIILSAILVAGLPLLGQVDLNLTSNFGYALTSPTEMIVDHDSIILWGVIIPDVTTNRQGVFIAKLDSLGNLVYLNEVYDPLGDKYSGASNWSKLIKTRDGGYASTTATYPRKGYTMIKFDKQLATEFIRDYPETDTTNLSNFFSRIVELPDSSGYMICGYVQRFNYFREPYLRHIDRQGNTLWHEFYKFSKQNSYYYDSRVIDDQHLMSIFMIQDDEVPDTLRSQVTIFDFEGNIIKTWQTEPYPQIGFLRQIVHTDSSGYVFYAHTLADVITFPNPIFDPIFLYQSTLVKLDTNFQVVWRRQFGPIEPLYKQYWFNKFIKRQDGFIGVGEQYKSDVDQYGRERGWVCGFSTTGDSLWCHYLQNDTFPDDANTSDLLLAVDTLSSGSIIACGYSKNFSEYTWIVKLTRDGCVDTLACLTNAVRHPPKQAQTTGWQVYPNPATTQVYWQPTAVQAIGISVMDMTGRIWINEPVSQPALDISRLPAGIYQACLSGEKGLIGRCRIVVVKAGG